MTRFPTDGVNPGTYVSGASKDHQFLMGSEVEVAEESNYRSKVKAWNSETGQLVFEQGVEGVTITAFQVSNDHKFISFASSFENTIYVFDFQTGAKIHEFKGHTSMIELTEFSDDSKRLISSALDGTRRVWNLEKQN